MIYIVTTVAAKERTNDTHHDVVDKCSVSKNRFSKKRSHSCASITDTTANTIISTAEASLTNLLAIFIQVT